MSAETKKAKQERQSTTEHKKTADTRSPLWDALHHHSVALGALRGRLLVTQHGWARGSR